MCYFIRCSLDPAAQMDLSDPEAKISAHFRYLALEKMRVYKIMVMILFRVEE